MGNIYKNKTLTFILLFLQIYVVSSSAPSAAFFKDYSCSCSYMQVIAMQYGPLVVDAILCTRIIVK